MSQKRMGPAPFASFEDLSDEVRHGASVESPPPPAAVRLPDIRERREPPVTTVCAAGSCLQTPSTPRIDISRASSSSHHEEEDNSRDSTPERELFEPQCAGGQRLGPAFGEDGAMDLRSSTEELDFQDGCEAGARAAHAAANVSTTTTARKDSQGSELAFLLSVSGRTSRLSSIGSQGSRASNQSRLSGVSAASGRSPSPHRMLVETSFCGDKASAAPGAAQPPLEHALLSRRHDPAEAVLAEGICIELRRKVQQPETSPQRRRRQQPAVEPTVVVTAPPAEHPTPPPPPMSPGRTIVSESGTEFTFIPLKGPLPSAAAAAPRKPQRQTVAGNPQYIRIKLKPDHMYADAGARGESVSPEPRKPVTLNLNNGTSRPPRRLQQQQQQAAAPPQPVHSSRTPSPSASRKSSFTSLFRSKEAVAASSPDSPGERARSKSKEREHKPSSVFGIFKPKPPKSCIKKQQQPAAPAAEQRSPLPNLEFSFNGRPRPRLKYYETPLEGDSIRIPLHSPGAEPEPPPRAAASPPSAATVPAAPAAAPPVNPRHSSTSSETIVFSTNLGSNNEIFTTKLPKENHCEKPTVERAESPPPPLTRSGSSESERGPSAAVHGSGDDEHELKTLVFQQDSFEEDELPYVPTTLPLERSVAVPIVPVKQRGEIRMCPIERPRSTTPINPSCLEDYCEDGAPAAEPKLRISLPRDADPPVQHKGSRHGARWADFAETGMGGGLTGSASPPPPLPPRGAPRDWINFEEVPERRKPPKRIQTIPTAGGGPRDDAVVYSYVNPEDCKCECHELAAAHPQPPTPDAFPDRQRPPS